MSESIISGVFKIIGALVLALIVFNLICSAAGQTFLWQGIHPALEITYLQSTMDNGVERSVVFEDEFETIKEVSDKSGRIGW